MATLAELIPDPEIMLNLEPEEVAGLVMELITSSKENEANRLHPNSMSHPSVLGDYPQNKREEITRVVMEGWQWLVHEGFIAPRPGDTSGWFFVTRKGNRLRTREDVNSYRNEAFLRKDVLHPRIAGACWSSFLRGEYDTAVFQAFKELEVLIREKGGFAPEEYGVALARKAFNKSNGVFTDKTVPVPEREALSHLMAGAIGSYKNPHSHRKVELKATEAAEMIILGSHLIKIVEARTR